MEMVKRQQGLTKVQNKLDDLESSDPLFPRHADAPRALEVVPVHHDMDHEIQGDGDP